MAGATGYFVCQIIAMLFDWQVAAMVLLAVGIATMVAAAVDSGRR